MTSRSLKGSTSLIAIVLTMLILAAPARAQIKGAGATSCGVWVQSRKDGSWSVDLNWVLGFVSSYNHFVGRNIFGTSDAYAVAVWMDNYCQKNPLNTQYEGAIQLVSELSARAKAK